jgi:Cdc6-like AAA superfamily ATPase
MLRYKNIAIEGAPGSGKTLLMDYLVKRFGMLGVSDPSE